MSYPEDYQDYDGETPDHLADTGPVRSINPDDDEYYDDDDPNGVPGWRRAFGCLSLVGAAALTIGAMVLILTAPQANEQPLPESTLQQQPTQVVNAVTTAVPQNTVEAIPNQRQAISALPTLSPDQQVQFLSSPIQLVSSTGAGEPIRNIYNPFTIVGDRTRSEVETYVVESGDTIISIAERYSLEPETVIWSNSRDVALALRPGQELNILPVNGVYYQALNDTSIADIAAQYQVDPYLIIDSQYNDLFGALPEDILPSGMWVVIPGARGESINWNPVVERVDASGASGAAAGTGSISFAPGEPGSCGLVSNPGSNGGWTYPLNDYQWIRGFSGVHSGVDLSAPIGTPVASALGGTVIFAGWNSYGYGYTIVLAHGPYTTLYGHLVAINVGCGQTVGSGQIIGATGSSGNSSGPHLHFEIRYYDTPTDPTYTLAF